MFRKMDNPQSGRRKFMLLIFLFFFQVVFNFVMFETFDVVDLFIPAADALWLLICCHQVRHFPLTF